MEVKIDHVLLLGKLKECNVITSWTIDDSVDSTLSWLNQLESLQIESDIVIEGPCAFYRTMNSESIWQVNFGLCTMGAYSYSHSNLPSSLIVGRYTSIAKGLRFLDFSHPVDWLSSSVAFFSPVPLASKSALAEWCDRKISDTDSNYVRKDFDPRCGKRYPIIGNDVWIGENVTLAMGISIGDGSIVASNSTVTGDVPPFAIVAGNPARVKKYRFAQTLISSIQSSCWWDYDALDFNELDYTDPKNFINSFNKLKKNIRKINNKKIKISVEGKIDVLP